MTRTSHLSRRAHAGAARVLKLSVLGLATAALTGCVSQEKYAAMKLRGDQAQEQLSAAEAQAKTATAQYEVLHGQLEAMRNSGESKDALFANLTATNADLKNQVQDLNTRYQGAIDLAGKAGTTPLPVTLTNELTTLAEQNPGVVDFDSARGLIKFKSDVTFSPGSAEATDAAKQVIDKVATILNSPTASHYDLMVVGHTDNQPVSNPRTIAAGNKDNWFLSVHRAIAVSKELQKQGVSTGRIEVAGRADQVPIAPNDTEANKAKNRRVEVLILPTSAHSAVAAAPPASPGAIPAAAPIAAKTGKPAADPNKDANKDAPPAPPADRRPYLGK